MCVFTCRAHGTRAVGGLPRPVRIRSLGAEAAFSGSLDVGPPSHAAWVAGRMVDCAYGLRVRTLGAVQARVRGWLRLLLVVGTSRAAHALVRRRDPRDGRVGAGGTLLARVALGTHGSRVVSSAAAAAVVRVCDGQRSRKGSCRAEGALVAPEKSCQVAPPACSRVSDSNMVQSVLFGNHASQQSLQNKINPPASTAARAGARDVERRVGAHGAIIARICIRRGPHNRAKVTTTAPRAHGCAFGHGKRACFTRDTRGLAGGAHDSRGRASPALAARIRTAQAVRACLTKRLRRGAQLNAPLRVLDACDVCGGAVGAPLLRVGHRDIARGRWDAFSRPCGATEQPGPARGARLGPDEAVAACFCYVHALVTILFCSCSCQEMNTKMVAIKKKYTCGTREAHAGARGLGIVSVRSSWALDTVRANGSRCQFRVGPRSAAGTVVFRGGPDHGVEGP